MNDYRQGWVPLRAKAECFSGNDSLIEVLHCPELVIPNGEMKCKVQWRRPIRVTLRAKVEYFSFEDPR